MPSMIDETRRALLGQMLACGAIGLAGAATSGESATPAHADPPSAVTLLAKARALMAGRETQRLRAFLSEWPHATEPRGVVPTTVPAVRWLPQVRASAPRFSTPFVDALWSAAPSLAWQRSYSVAAVGATFYDNYGWTELAGLTGPVPSTHLACGLLILGPHLTYPAHRHEAEEIYIPLSGTAEWRHGGVGWRERAPGSVIHHASNESHAMRTGGAPMLGLYLWHSDNLAQKSRLDA
jgi:quercetin dioxygenase-like cupin family protein